MLGNIEYGSQLVFSSMKKFEGLSQKGLTQGRTSTKDMFDCMNTVKEGIAILEQAQKDEPNNYKLANTLQFAKTFKALGDLTCRGIKT